VAKAGYRPGQASRMLVSAAVARRVMLLHSRYGHTLRFYIRPHFRKCRAVVALKLHLVPRTAARPNGFPKQALCKVAYAGERCCAALVFLVRRCAHCFSRWPAASYVVSAPAHPRASPLRGISPARWTARPPPAGAPSASAKLGRRAATSCILSLTVKCGTIP